MAENVLVDVLLSVFDFFRGAFFLSVLVFVLFLVAYFFSKEVLEKKFNFSWMQKAFFSSFFVFVLLLLVVFVWPVIDAFLSVDVGVLPDPLKMTLSEFFYLAAYLLIKLVVLSLVFSVFVLPLAFVGAFAFDFFSEKFKWNKFINFFLAVFVATSLALFVVLFLMPWIVSGALYLVYFSRLEKNLFLIFLAVIAVMFFVFSGKKTKEKEEEKK